MSSTPINIRCPNCFKQDLIQMDLHMFGTPHSKICGNCDNEYGIFFRLDMKTFLLNEPAKRDEREPAMLE